MRVRHRLCRTEPYTGSTVNVGRAFRAPNSRATPMGLGVTGEAEVLQFPKVCASCSRLIRTDKGQVCVITLGRAYHATCYSVTPMDTAS